MDALDVLMNKDKISPFFQPIVSADTQLIIGYEVLGRIQLNDQWHSLGDFFNNDSVPEEYIVEVDEYIQTKAFDLYCEEKMSCNLFINCNSNILLNEHHYFEQLITRIHSYREKGLDLKKIVFELKEDNYNGDLSQLRHLVTYLQSIGTRVAIDDVGKGGSNLDRIAQLEPDILKVDLNFIQAGTISQPQRDVLYSLSMFARRIGATLLFEGIGDLSKLSSAWKNGGRYYQGFYLEMPSPTFVSENCCKEKLTKEFQHFINYETNKLNHQYDFTEELHQKVEAALKKDKRSGHDEILVGLTKSLNDVCFRMYICDQYGFQLSKNFLKNKEEGSWDTEEEYVGINWSWRPYFLENIIRMEYEKKGILSDLYSDIETNEFIRTFSYPLGDHQYLFLDIPYAFLFERDGLLY